MPTALENLGLALATNLSVIVFGYALSRFRIIQADAERGIGKLVGMVSLPALLFLSMAKLDLATIQWKIVLCLFLGKGVVFLVGAMIGIARDRSWRGIKDGGIMGIFSCQSNDFAIGLPVLAALFPPGEPGGVSPSGIDYVSYIYVAAPVQLAVLNCIGFLMMEAGSTYLDAAKAARTPIDARGDSAAAAESGAYQATSASSGAKTTGPDNTAGGVAAGGVAAVAPPSAWRIVSKILLRTFTNKVVLMTFLGLLWNVTVRRVPAYVDEVMTILGAAYTPGALLLVGMSMNKEGVTFKGRKVMWPLVLVGLKLVLLPMLMRLFSSFFGIGTDGQDFLFIYGGLPTAPSVYLFATEFAAIPDPIAAGTIICTVLFAPLMIATTVLVTSPSIPALENIVHSISQGCVIASLVGTLLVLAVPLYHKRWRRYPMDIILCFAGSRFFYCLTRLAFCERADMDTTNGTRIYGITNIFRTWSRMWLLVTAVNLTMYAARGREAAMRYRRAYHVVAWVSPVVVLIPLAFAIHTEPPKSVISHCVYLYGPAQYIFDAVTLILTAGAIVATLILVEHFHATRGKVPKDLTLMSSARALRDSGVSQPLLAGGGGPADITASADSPLAGAAVVPRRTGGAAAAAAAAAGVAGSYDPPTPGSVIIDGQRDGLGAGTSGDDTTSAGATSSEDSGRRDSAAVAVGEEGGQRRRRRRNRGVRRTSRDGYGYNNNNDDGDGSAYAAFASASFSQLSAARDRRALRQRTRAAGGISMANLTLSTAGGASSGSHQHARATLSGSTTPMTSKYTERHLERRVMAQVSSDKFRIQLFLTCALIGVVTQIVIVLSLLSAKTDRVTSGTVLQIATIGMLFTEGIGFWLALIFAAEKGAIASLVAIARRARHLVRRYVYGIDDLGATKDAALFPMGAVQPAASSSSSSSAAAARSGAGAAGEPGTVLSDEQDNGHLRRRKWFSIVRGAYENGLVGDRTYFFRTYPDVFVAHEFVSWLVDSSRALNRDEAIDIGSDLVRHGVIHHVTFEHGFKDSYLFFRFTSEILSEVLDDLSHLDRDSNVAQHQVVSS